MPSLRFSYLYQEDVAQIIDAKIPICLLNNKTILISGDANQLLPSYLLSNLITLKKFYNLNMTIYTWPETKVYFGCDCIKGIEKLSDIKDDVDYIIDIDRKHSRELPTFAAKHGSRIAILTSLDSSEDFRMFGESCVTIKTANLFGLLSTQKNLIQSTIEGLVNDVKTLLPDINVKIVTPEKAAIGILKALLSEETKVELVDGTVNPNNLLLNVVTNDNEKYALEVIKVLKRDKDEKDD